MNKFLTLQKSTIANNLISINTDDSMEAVKDMVDLPANRYSIEHDHSVLKYRAMTDADYGFLFCWAENAVGEQVNILLQYNDKKNLNQTFNHLFAKQV
jgi:hypothetical protein